MAKIYCKSSYLLRKDTAENWRNKNPVLRLGEEGYETDTRKRKVGDGSTNWVNLKYGSVEVDNAMSSTSENPVQNKIVKKYVDDTVGDIETVLATMFNEVTV